MSESVLRPDVPRDGGGGQSEISASLYCWAECFGSPAVWAVEIVSW
jgi:hypothetical protein